MYIRKLISSTARIEDFCEAQAEQMIVDGRQLFQTFCFMETQITPSMWVLSNVTPFQTKTTLSQYGLGIGVNSMEGREQKHQRIKRYAENTTFQNKWPMIFRHEFVQLIFLRERGYDETHYYRKQKSYLHGTTVLLLHTLWFRLSYEFMSTLLSPTP